MSFGKFKFVWLAGVFTALAWHPAGAQSTAEIRWTDVHQRITGFGASGGNDSASNFQRLSAANQQALADLLFRTDTGIGLSMVRNEIYAWQIEPSKGVWDWTKDADQVWLMNAAKTRGVSYFWSATWSPPAWMKSNGSINNGGSLNTANYQDYADLLSQYVRQYKTQFGLDISAVSITNEPEFAASYESCLWSSTQIRDFIKNNLGPTFANDSVTAKIVMPESISWDTMFSTASATMNDATARGYVGVVASHQYNSTSLLSAYTPAKTYNKELWQTEVSFIGGTPDYSIDSGVQTAMLIHNAMAGAETNAWVWWVFLNSWGDNEGLADLSGTNYVVAKRLWAMGNYSRFVRPGYYMIGATYNPTTDVYVTAYKDPSSGAFAIVAINNSSSSKSMNFTMTGFTSTSITPWVTSASANLAQQSAITPSGGAFSATLAGKSVTTFVGSTGAASSTTPNPPTNLQAQ